MSALTLIDSSAWIEFLRPNGNQQIADQVEEALTSGIATTCDIILLELWNGAGNQQQRKHIQSLENNLQTLPQNKAVWKTAKTLATKARAKGLSIPSTDLLIYATSQIHKTTLLHQDKHFNWLAQI